MNRNKTILIVDDDRGFAQSLSSLLNASGYRTLVSFDPAGALAMARQNEVQCALLDYNLGATLGTTLLTRFKEEAFDFPCLMITAYGDVRTATQAMKLGAVDFIEKPFEPNDLIAAIETAMAEKRDEAMGVNAIREARQTLKRLTPRESEIVDAIVAGKSSKQIAENLAVSQRTVETHRANILDKLQIANTASLVRLAVLAGLGSPGEQ
jgi:two-component system, LuxR family, response regulator FixJ